MIEQAFHAYTTAVEAKFESNQRTPTTKEGNFEWLNKEIQLRHLVDQLEKRPEFSALVRETLSAFRSDDWHSASGESWWKDPICQFFRRTGYYTDTFFKASVTPCDLFQRYETAFRRRSIQTTYLAPLEFVQFPTRKPDLKVSGFEIRKIDRKELDEKVCNYVNRIFYPHAVVDTSILQEYWFIVATKPEIAPRLRTPQLNISREMLGFVSPEYTRFPPAIEHVLERLVLFDWLEEPQERGKPQNDLWPYGSPFGFNIPFVIRVDDNDLERPKSAPDCSTLESYGIKHADRDTEEEYKGHLFVFDLNESRAAAFVECIQRADECLGHMRLETDDTRWSFLKVAIDNLIKAFFTEELEQLLWHITALEAMLGEPGPGLTESLSRRSAAILGTTKRERENWKKKFKHLYDLRSDLVHGRKYKKDIHRQQLFEARMMTMRVTIWFVHYLGEIAARINEQSWGSKIPKREDILILLDLSEADRSRLNALLRNLPNDFPAAPDWSP